MVACVHTTFNIRHILLVLLNERRVLQKNRLIFLRLRYHKKLYYGLCNSGIVSALVCIFFK